MNKLLVGLAVLALLLVGCFPAIAGELPKNEWSATFGIGRYLGADFKEGKLLDDRGTAYWADVLKPFEFNLWNRDWEMNTKLVFQFEDDFKVGGALAIKGITFFEKDLNTMTLSSGADPLFLTNFSEGYRVIFEKEEFIFNEMFEFGAIVYIGIAF